MRHERTLANHRFSLSPETVSERSYIASDGKSQVQPLSLVSAPYSLNHTISIMRTNPLLLGTMASVLAIGNASPIPQGDAIIIVDDVAPNVGRPIRWLRESDGTELCLQVDSITGPPEAQLRNGGSVTL